MTAYNYLYLITIFLVMIGWGAKVYAEGDVTIYNASTSSGTITPVNLTAATDGTPVVHKSLHRHKKKTPAADTAPQDGSTTTGTVATTSTSSAAKKKTTSTAKKAATVPSITMSAPAPSPAASSAPVTVKSSPDSTTQITISAPVVSPSSHSNSSVPEVETGLPIARHDLGNHTMTVNPSSVPNSTTLPHSSYQMASTFPLTPGIPAASTLGSYRAQNPLDNFTFTNFDKRAKNTYPWKLNIITTIFWIGEGDTPISSTDNIASAWDQDWTSNNGGADSPNNRDMNGYAPARHAAMVNPFYVALPFNDLAFPDKARRWLPTGWYRSPRNGKQVSACKDRWVEIKNAQGDVCYAQWEDVGPLRYDHAEYVFGNERPDTLTRAGLDVSPAVAKYLNINEKNRITRWRFVDDADVPPGYWLKYDEEALLFKAMKNDPGQIKSIDQARAPIDDQTDIDSNKKRVGAAKG